MLHEDRRRAEVFGDDAEQYDRSRPRYPDQMIDDLLARLPGRSPVRVVDVGCGTGIAARQFRDRGCAVLGVEADQRMASVASAHGIDVEVSRFETWNDRGQRFDLLTAGQSWHWVDPVAGAQRAADVLDAGGVAALFWNTGRPPEDVQRAFDDVYARVPPETDKDSLMTGSRGLERFESAIDGLRRCGRFDEPVTKRYSWEHYYTAEEWLDQLQTHSDHRLLPKATIRELLGQIGEVIRSAGGGFTMGYRTWLIVAPRRDA